MNLISFNFSNGNGQSVVFSNLCQKCASLDFVSTSILLLAYLDMINIELAYTIAIFHWPMV